MNLNEPYYDFVPKWFTWPYYPNKKYYTQIAKKMKHRKRKKARSWK